MTPEEIKAKELLQKFRNNLSWIEVDYNVDLYRESKEAAAFCIKEIIEVLGSSGVYGFADPKIEQSWQQVLKHIEA